MCFGGSSSPSYTYEKPAPPAYTGDTTRVDAPEPRKWSDTPVSQDDPAQPRPATTILTDTNKQTTGKTLLGR